MIPDSMWQTFHSKVATAASHIWSEKAEMVGMLGLPLTLVGVLSREVLQEMFLIVHLVCVVSFVALFLGTRMFLVNQNRIQDKAIEEACSELASATGMSMTVQYRTQYVGFCKPKGAHPYRAIAIVPKDPVIIGVVLAEQPLLPSSGP
jgi:PII-like signaling protein